LSGSINQEYTQGGLFLCQIKANLDIDFILIK
jgi:hypothetical protein